MIVKNKSVRRKVLESDANGGTLPELIIQYVIRIRTRDLE